MFKLLGSVRSRVRDLYSTVTAPQPKEASEPSEDSDETDVDEEGEETMPHEILSEQGYTLEEAIGVGSFSSVHKAFSERHDRHVAIKIITKKKVPHLYMEKFLPREIELIKSLKHENVIKFISVTETTKSIYVVMNIAVNGNLLEVIRINHFIDEKRACRWFHHLVDGIGYCHSKGVAHRDLKCENLLLDSTNILKITDFSFAREGLPKYIVEDEENTARSRRFSSTFCGSYAYACPEVLMRKPYEPHLSDTWSMGVILYSMLYGRLPFDDKDYNYLVQQVTRPVKFRCKPTISFNARNLILKILSPPYIRIYIPKIKKEEWYVDNFDPNEEEEFRKPEALRKPVGLEGLDDTRKSSKEKPPYKKLPYFMRKHYLNR